MTMKSAHLVWLPLLLTACQRLPATQSAMATIAPEGRAFAQETCGECHAVAPHGTSPNSKAPPFPQIVNQEGLTAQTLSVWLRGAHNYPAEMDFYLGEQKVDALVAYMLTLKDPNYTRPPD